MLGVSCGLGSAAPSMTLGLLAALCVVKQRNCAVTWTRFFSFLRDSRVCPLSGGHVNIMSQRVRKDKRCQKLQHHPVTSFLIAFLWFICMRCKTHACVWCLSASLPKVLHVCSTAACCLHLKVNKNSFYFLNACLVVYFTLMSLLILYWRDTDVFFFFLFSSQNVITCSTYFLFCPIPQIPVPFLVIRYPGSLQMCHIM